MAGPRAERSLVAAAALAVAATVGGACVDADVVSIDSGKALPTSSTVVEDEDVLAIGSSIETARGNTVGVLDAAASESGVHTLIEACAARGSTEHVGVSLSFFTVQLQDGRTVAPIDPRDAREP